LPYSKQEIENIASMAAGKTSEHLGDADLKSRFLAAPSRQAPILHVSTHAYVDTDVPESSRMLFSPETSSGPAEYLFLRELYDLDLSAVDMAVLSACNTDRGKLVRGEGVQAFSRALLFAGSRSALTTMWRVADQPTSEFMKQFYYFALVKRQSRAEAMRSAKLKFLNSNSQLANPAHWAGFVLNGDGMSGLPYFISWGALATSGAVIVLALGVAVWLGLGLRRRVHRLDRPKSVVAQ
jgi:CHAT domain-containing protein